jgi:hypothetical protein
MNFKLELPRVEDYGPLAQAIEELEPLKAAVTTKKAAYEEAAAKTGPLWKSAITPATVEVAEKAQAESNRLFDELALAKRLVEDQRAVIARYRRPAVTWVERGVIRMRQSFSRDVYEKAVALMEAEEQFRNLGHAVSVSTERRSTFPTSYLPAAALQQIRTFLNRTTPPEADDEDEA